MSVGLPWLSGWFGDGGQELACTGNAVDHALHITRGGDIAAGGLTTGFLGFLPFGLGALCVAFGHFLFLDWSQVAQPEIGDDSRQAQDLVEVLHVSSGNGYNPVPGQSPG